MFYLNNPLEQHHLDVKGKLSLGNLVKYEDPRKFTWLHIHDLDEIKEWSHYYRNNIGIIVDMNNKQDESILVYWPDSKSYWCTEEELIFVGGKHV